jgi:O-antigen/teichoic acid export membrane protein
LASFDFDRESNSVTAHQNSSKTWLSLLWLLAAKGWFLVAGFGLHLLFPALAGFGAYGAFRRALSVLNPVTNLVAIATLQNASLIASQGPSRGRWATIARQHALLAMSLLALFLALIVFVLRRPDDPSQLKILLLLSPLIALYAIYGSLLGVLNGLAHFSRQASLDATHSSLRVIAILTGAAIGTSTLGALGASVGHLVGTSCAVAIGVWFLTRAKGFEVALEPKNKHDHALIAIVSVQFFQSALYQVDLFALSRKWITVMPSDATDRLAGVYGQLQAFGLIPLIFGAAVTQIVFPELSRATTNADRKVLSQGATLTLLVAWAAASASPRALAFGLFGHRDTQSAAVLHVLVLAHSLTAVCTVCWSALIAMGRQRAAIALSAIAVVVAYALCQLGFVLFSQHLWPLVAALSLAVGTLAAAIAVGIQVRLAGLDFVPIRALLGGLLAVAIAASIGWLLPVPQNRALALAVACVPCVVYLVVVTATCARTLRDLLVRDATR